MMFIGTCPSDAIQQQLKSLVSAVSVSMVGKIRILERSVELTKMLFKLFALVFQIMVLPILLIISFKVLFY